MSCMYVMYVMYECIHVNSCMYGTSTRYVLELGCASNARYQAVALPHINTTVVLVLYQFEVPGTGTWYTNTPYSRYYQY